MHTTTTCEANPTLLSWLLPSTCLDLFTKDGMAYKSQLTAAAATTVDEERETIKHAHPLSSFSDW
jgi:hypothetical protein